MDVYIAKNKFIGKLTSEDMVTLKNVLRACLTFFFFFFFFVVAVVI